MTAGAGESSPPMSQGEAMLVRMLEHILGTRDGKAWPPRGGIVDLPESEALALFAHGYAQPVAVSGSSVNTHQDDQAATEERSSMETAMIEKTRSAKPRRAKA